MGEGVKDLTGGVGSSKQILKGDGSKTELEKRLEKKAKFRGQ